MFEVLCKWIFWIFGGGEPNVHIERRHRSRDSKHKHDGNSPKVMAGKKVFFSDKSCPVIFRRAPLTFGLQDKSIIETNSFLIGAAPVGSRSYISGVSETLMQRLSLANHKHVYKRNRQARIQEVLPVETALATCT